MTSGPDLVVAADPRLRGAEGRALARLLGVAAAAGYRTALLPVLGPTARPSSTFHKDLRRLLDAGEVALLDPDRPVEAALALGWHWLPFAGPASRPARLRAERALLRIDQPFPADPDAAPLDRRRLSDEAARILGAVPTLLAGDPLLAAELGLGGPPAWWATVPEASDRSFVPGDAYGRHAAGGEGAFAPGIVPASAGGRWVFAEAAAERLLSEPELPAGLELRPGELDDPEAFLRGLRAWVMLTGETWRPMLPTALLEALTMAPLVVGSPKLRPLLGEAAVALTDDRELEAITRDAVAIARARQGALDLWRRHASPDALRERLRAELGAPATRSGPTPIRLRRGERRRRRVLCLSPNGIGMGHVTRLLAVARRLPPPLEPVFLTMSQGSGVIRDLGFIVEYTPYHQASRESAAQWRQHFRAKLQETIAFYDPAVILFDGNVPYQPLIDIVQLYPDRPFVWLRRALWRPESGRDTIDRARHFDLVIEPGELAAALDRGITVPRGEEVVAVPPVILLDPAEMASADEAKARLGLDPGKVAVLVQLGGRNNFDYRDIDRALGLVLGGDPTVETVVLDWVIGERPDGDERGFRHIQAYPTARWLHGFDLAVGAAGYNSFHEACAAGLPTVWVPNENPMMDEQELRGLWAERQGIGHLARAGDPHRLVWAIRRMLDPAVRAAMRARATELPACDGAARVARLIEELATAHPQHRAGSIMAPTLAR